MTEEKKPEQKRERRRHATEAAGKIGPMVKEYFGRTLRAEEEGNPLAYTFINCCYDEIIRAMDIIPVWSENFAGICGAKRVAQKFLERAEAQNFSRSMCTYALCGLGHDQWREELGEMPPESPWGGQARPDVMLSSGQILCDPRNKWYQALQQYMPDVPVHNVCLPWPLYEKDVNIHEVEDYYIKYIIEELRDLIRFLEKQLHKKMDWERLSEIVDLTDRTWNMVIDSYELRKAVPTPMGTGDAMNTMVPMTFMMGTQEAYDFYKDLYEELKLKIDNKEGVISDEKYRLIWAGGLPSWFALGDFNYFNSKGAVFPVETTYRIVERIDRLDLPKTSDPLEHLAWRWVRNWTYWYDKARKRPGSEPDIERIIQYIEEYKIDGIVMHETFSCRAWHVGLIWQLNQIAKIYKPIPTMIIGKDGREEQVYKELPSLILESDIIDISSYNEADTRARIDTFIDILDVVKSKRE